MSKHEKMNPKSLVMQIMIFMARGKHFFSSPKLTVDGKFWAYFRYALCPLYSAKTTPTCHDSIHDYCLGVHKCCVEG